MKRHFRHFFLVLLFPYYCIAQQGNTNIVVDSLLQKIATENIDSVLVGLYENVIIEYYESNPIIGIQYANKAIAIAKKNHLDAEVAYLNRLVGHCYFNISNYPKALQYFFTALKYDESKGDKLDAAFDMNSVAMAYRKEKNYDKSLVYYKKAWEVNEQDKRKFDLGNHIQGIGIVFQELKQYDSALTYYLKALDAHTKYKNEGGAKIAKINIGTAYLHLYQYSLAEKYLLEGLVEKKNEKNTHGIAIVANNLTELYNNMANPPAKANIKVSEANKKKYYQQAINYARLSIEASEELGEWDLRESAYSGMSIAQAGLENYKDALASFQKHELYKDSIYNESSKTEIANYTLQREMDIKNSEMETREKDLKFLFAIKEDSLKYAQNLATLRIKEQNHLLLLSSQNLALANKEKDFQRLEFLKTQLELSNSQAMTAEKEKEIRLAKLETDQKEQDIQLARKEALLQAVGKKNTVYVSLLGLILLSAAVGFYMNRLRMRQLKKLVEVRTNIAANLHDEVGSTLSSISMMSQVAKKKGGEGNELLEKISTNSQTMLDSMSDIVWSIRPDNDKLGDIISRIRLFAAETLEEQRIRVEMDIVNDIEKQSIPMELRKDIYLIAKEALINIVKYSQANVAHIIIHIEHKQLIMEIKDNGIGFDEDKTNTLGGNGLKNMKLRAERLKGNLSIKSKPDNGTIILLSIPLDNANT
ncbi:MAG: hypothetical protein JSS78_09030 [Bacteroidetes bacterium]|nr:hypothetical protein [Bacteroidota bacterium]